MNMNQRAVNMMKAWGILLVLLLLLHLGIFVAWVILEPSDSQAIPIVILLMTVYVVAFAIILYFFNRRMGLAHDPIEYREARKQELPAIAKVLEIEQTRWRIRRKRNLRLRRLPTRWEYAMRVQVSRQDEADYEATLAEFFTSAEIPKKGATIPIKVHPQRPEIIVLDRDEIT